MDEQSAKLVIAAGLLIGFLFWVVCVLMILKLRMQSPIEDGDVSFKKTTRDQALKNLLGELCYEQ